MIHIQKFLDQQNSWNGLFGGAQVAFPDNKAELLQVWDMVECDLSPENLTCDGEASFRHILSERKRLEAVQSELSELMRRLEK